MFIKQVLFLQGEEMQTNRSNTGALIGGAVLIALGILSLAGQVFHSLNWGFLWPFIVIGVGAMFFVAMFAGGKQAAALAVPGSIVGGIGLILLFQNITHYWESMSYFWTLILTLVGTGIYIMGLYGGDENHKRSGIKLMKIGAILFIIFGTFFELIFSSFSKIAFPILLIALGAYLILNRSGLLGWKKTDSSSNEDILPPSN
jgi:hypothetical protein